MGSSECYLWYYALLNHETGNTKCMKSPRKSMDLYVGMHYLPLCTCNTTR